MIDRMGVRNFDGNRHTVGIVSQQISTEKGPAHGYLAECSCSRFVAQAEEYEIVFDMVSEHFTDVLLVGAE